MTEFGKWIRRAIAPGTENIDQMDYDLANVAALLHGALVSSTASDYAQQQKLAAALRAAGELMGKYSHD